MGVDALQPDRVAQAMARWGPVYVGRVCSPAEQAEWGIGTGGVAVCLAVKECLIKAVGGRPHPFSWHDLRVGGVACRTAGRLLVDAGRALGAATGVTRFHSTGCAVRGRALCGAALWGESEDLIVAVVVLVEEDLC